jgi:hypothetical protein
MKMVLIALAIALSASMLAGCSSLKKFTGQRDDTVLPGEREDILPADQQVNPPPNKAGGVAADSGACDPTVDFNCDTAVDQESTTPEDIQ